MTVASIFEHPLGRLQWSSLPFWEMLQHPTKANLINGSIATLAASLLVIGGLIVVALLGRYHLWRPLWSNWVTSVDHK
ncbi:MAG: hypothetical protein ABI379_12170, partial [Rhodanobacter sp.]